MRRVLLALVVPALSLAAIGAYVLVDQVRRHWWDQ